MSAENTIRPDPGQFSINVIIKALYFNMRILVYSTTNTLGSRFSGFFLKSNLVYHSTEKVNVFKVMRPYSIEKVGLRPYSIEDRDPIPLNQKGGTLFRICTATLLSETLFSLPEGSTSTSNDNSM